MTTARQVIAGRTYLISRRCTQRQFLLRPEPKVDQIYLYCLGEAAQRFGITLHGFMAMSNHQHLVIRDNHANFPEFLAHLHKMISKLMNAHLGREENFWATEQPSAVYLVERGDRFSKLMYLLANPVAAHLVDRISDWPGASSFALHVSGRTTMTVERPKHFFAPDTKMPDEVTLTIERPDGFEDLSDDEWTTKVRDALRVKEDDARALRMKENRGVLGRKRVLSADPTDRPTSIEEDCELRPTIACQNKPRRIYELAVLRAFHIVRDAAVAQIHAKVKDVVVPLGTYRVHGFFQPLPIAA